ncbi:MAG: exodeoxyribonuclease VII small subunit [Gammaproteobacteria bacterium]|nr:MAG: exodeoxyribonuclease VII small subunit [Gammaproteobacteria bacterium]
MPRKKTHTPDFEQSLKQLELLVEKMEQGDLTLEQQLECYENGIKLSRTCQVALTKAEQKVRILMEKNGQQDVEPFDRDE